MVDGRKEKVGNYHIEPPGLFQGRGAHPLQGKLKVYFLILPLFLFVFIFFIIFYRSI